MTPEQAMASLPLVKKLVEDYKLSHGTWHRLGLNFKVSGEGAAVYIHDADLRVLPVPPSEAALEAACVAFYGSEVEWKAWQQNRTLIQVERFKLQLRKALQGGGQ